jgi:hypothetical protein
VLSGQDSTLILRSAPTFGDDTQVRYQLLKGQSWVCMHVMGLVDEL